MLARAVTLLLALLVAACVVACQRAAAAPTIVIRNVELGAKWCDTAPYCDSSCFTPAVLCPSYQRMNFDGCHWACREWGP